MKSTTRPQHARGTYHPQAYQFIRSALPFTQKRLGRVSSQDAGSEAHISGQELSQGIRIFACEQYGLLARVVLKEWGIVRTSDFGYIVFDLIERQEMRKSSRDQLSDFDDVYDFQDAFDRDYKIDVSPAFRRA